MNSLFQYYIFYFTIILLLSIILFRKFKEIAPKFNLLDKPSLVNVHTKSVPTGSGIIFLVIFFISIGIFFYLIKIF